MSGYHVEIDLGSTVGHTMKSENYLGVVHFVVDGELNDVLEVE